MLKRKLHWATRAYHDFLVSRATASFVWGENDCALFAADGIMAMTGVDIAADFRGKYTDEAGAFELIKSVTGGATVGDAAAWCAATHGLPERAHPLMAQRGDLVVFAAPSGELVSGLVHLSGQIVAVGERGLYRFPITKTLRSWQIG